MRGGGVLFQLSRVGVGGWGGGGEKGLVIREEQSRKFDVAMPASSPEIPTRLRCSKKQKMMTVPPRRGSGERRRPVSIGEIRYWTGAGHPPPCSVHSCADDCLGGFIKKFRSRWIARQHDEAQNNRRTPRKSEEARSCLCGRRTRQPGYVYERQDQSSSYSE